jgi:protein disulfide isomerase family A protein 5
MWSKKSTFIGHIILLAISISFVASKTAKFDEIVDHKEFKKLMKTKNNILVAFHDLPKSGAGSKLLTLLSEVSEKIKGLGTIASVDCGDKEGRKLCKKMKIIVPANQNFVLKHFKDGSFHKDFDRKLNLQSIVNFMKDPTSGKKCKAKVVF